MTETGLLGLAIDHRAGGGELIAKPDIIHEAGDLAVGLAAFGGAHDQVRQRRQLVEIDFLAHRPAVLVGLFREREVLGGDMDRALLMVMQHDAIGALERLDLDLGLLDRAQVHPRDQPALEEDIVQTVAGAHDNVGAVDGLLRLCHRRDFDA